MILFASKGMETTVIAPELGVDFQRVARWRKRWSAEQSTIHSAEGQGASDKDLTGIIVGTLSDAYRSGAAPTFSAEQMTQIVALACEKPEESGYPVTHWTPKELRAEAIRREVVEDISIRHLDRFLKGGGSASSQVPLLDDFQG
jgi:putative transposase